MEQEQETGRLGINDDVRHQLRFAEQHLPLHFSLIWGANYLSKQKRKGKMFGSGDEQGGEAAASTTLETTKWMKVQDLLKKQLIVDDDFAWKFLIPRATCHEIEEEEAEAACWLKYIGGVDISYSKEDPSSACATLVVLELHTLQLVYQDHALVKLNVPYVPSFLAFREAPILLHLLYKMKTNSNPFYPQVLMVDGNGLLHPRGFGLACHVGVLAQLPTIGIGKNLHNVDGLTQFRVRHLLQAKENEGEDSVALVGTLGVCGEWQ